MSCKTYFVLYKVEHNFSEDWNWNNVKVVTIFNDFEVFKTKYTNNKPSALLPATDYRFFREKIKPSWSDPSNEEGGRFVLSNLEQLDDDDFDFLWLETVKFIMTSDFEEVADIVGALAKSRKNPTLRRTISIWVGSSCSKANRLEIGEQLKNYLNLEKLYFGFHKEIGDRAQNKIRSH